MGKKLFHSQKIIYHHYDTASPKRFPICKFVWQSDLDTFTVQLKHNNCCWPMINNLHWESTPYIVLCVTISLMLVEPHPFKSFSIHWVISAKYTHNVLFIIARKCYYQSPSGYCSLQSVPVEHFRRSLWVLTIVEIGPDWSEWLLSNVELLSVYCLVALFVKQKSGSSVTEP